MTRSSPAECDDGVVVTVIIPVFNTDPRLIDRAVFSALAQTYPHIDLLVVDDGSTAEIAQFLDQVAERDPRIRIVHRTNGGVSAARNIGIELALGDFIAHLDADDYLVPDFIAAALTAVRRSDADAVFGGIRVLNKTGAVEWRSGGPTAEQPLLGTSESIVSACVSALSDSPSPFQPTKLLSLTNVVSCLYKADTARLNRFPEGVSHAEDRLHNLHFLLDAVRVAFCSDVWYVYDATHDQGVTRRATTRTITALSRTVREFATVEETLRKNRGLSDDARERIAQAGADGTFSYLKVLSGVMATVGRRRVNRALLRQLLFEPRIVSAVARANHRGWQSQIFATAIRHRQVDLLLFLGALWARKGGGFQMSVDPSNGSTGGRSQHNG